MTFSPRCDPGGPGRRGRETAGRIVPVALLVLLTAAAGVFAQEKGAVPLPGGSGTAARGMLEPGAEAPGFTAKDISEEVFTFDVEKTKSPHLLVFFSIFCDPCRRELAIVQRLREKYRDASWRVVAVALDGGPLKHAVAGFARQEGYGFRVLMDELDARDAFRIADAYGVSEIPSTFVVEKGGRILFGRRGLAREEELEKALQSLPKP
jgi:peroxiredoxin